MESQTAEAVADTSLVPVSGPHSNQAATETMPPLDLSCDDAASVMPVRPKRTRTCRLHMDDDVIDAPSIGPRTAARVKATGIRSVRDLLAANPRRSARALKQRWITEELILAWQQQARLVCGIPGLSGTNAQLLVGLGIHSEAELAEARAEVLRHRVRTFAETSPGAEIVRSGSLPDEADIREWIQSARPSNRQAA